jgi:hypothetical protein
MPLVVASEGHVTRCLVCFSTPLPPSDRNQRRCNLADAALRSKQIKLRCGIACILYLEANAQAVQVFADGRRNGCSVWACADD